MGARNRTLLLLLLFPHRSSHVPCRETLADVGQPPFGFSRQFWTLWE